MAAKSPLERVIVRKIMDALRAEAERRGARLWLRKLHGTAMAISGDPDLYGWIRYSDRQALGVPIALEVKRPGFKPTEIQQHRLEQARDTGALCGVVHSAEEAIAIIWPLG